jgi:hypothetical protein
VIAADFPAVIPAQISSSSRPQYESSNVKLKMKLALNIAILAVTAVAVAMLADAWRSARRDSQQLAATLAAQNAVIQQVTGQEKQRDSQLASALAAIQTQKQNIKTPQQAAEAIPSVLSPLPLPISVSGPDLSVPLPPGDSPSATISVPQPDLVPLYDKLQDCRATSLQNDALQKDLADEKTRSAALQQERDVAKAAAHGGPILERIKRAAKWFAIGVAAGAVATAIAHH